MASSDVHNGEGAEAKRKPVSSIPWGSEEIWLRAEWTRADPERQRRDRLRGGSRGEEKGADGANNGQRD